QGISVFFVTNRLPEQRPGTIQTLAKYGLATDDMADTSSLALLMREPGPQGGNKDHRRSMIAERYDIIALIGDNLGDFSGEFDKSSGLASRTDREAVAEKNISKFGSEWFLLPNPLYGEWEKFLNRQDPASDLYQ